MKIFKRALAATLALVAVQAAGQSQSFYLPAYFTTNVFLKDDTNTTLSARIQALSSTGITAWASFPAAESVDAASNSILNVSLIDFDTADTNAVGEGELKWNTDAEKLEYGLVDGSLSLKIGDANILRVKADENILKGQVVSASGQTGNVRPNAILSDADSTNLTRRVPTGIALQNINNNQSGYIVTSGLSEGIDTTGYPQDVPLFLGSTPGSLSTNKPDYPYDGWYVAESVLSNATGQLVVNIVPCKRWSDLDGRYATTGALVNVSNQISTASGEAWSSYAATQAVDMAGNNLTNIASLTSTNLGINFDTGVVTGDVRLISNTEIEGRLVIGDMLIANIDESATGSWRAGLRSGGTSSIGATSYGSSQQGLFSVGTHTIGANTRGSVQRGSFGNATVTIGSGVYGASQIGSFGARAVIPSGSPGAMQLGLLPAGSVATNRGAGAVQIMGGTVGTYLTTAEADGSLLLGPGTNSVAYSVKAAGGFYGSAAGLTNFPSSLLRVSAANANYYRITTAPTGATASGSSGQIAVSGTNVYIYSANALGTGTSRWLRISGDASW